MDADARLFSQAPGRIAPDVDMAKFRIPNKALGGTTSKNTRVAGKPRFDGFITQKTRMLIVALDYQDVGLNCTLDAKNVEDLARQCMCDVTTLYNEECTKTKVLAAIDKVGQSCKQDDFFVFYFAGRGSQIADVSGDEDDGLDEAFVLVDENGKVTKDSLLVDDDFSDAIYNSVHNPRTRILLLADCGLDVADLSGGKWHGRKAISIAATSAQKKADATLGIFTHSMLLGVDKIGTLGIYHTRDKVGHLGLDKLYSVGMVYNAALLEDAAVFSSKQDLTIQCTKEATADRMPWPLIPPYSYESPVRQQAKGTPNKADDKDGDGVPDEKENRACTGQMFTGCAAPCRAPAAAAGTKEGKASTSGDLPWLSPSALKNATLREALGPTDPHYLEYIQGTDLASEVSRSCHSDKCVVS